MIDRNAKESETVCQINSQKIKMAKNIKDLVNIDI